MEVLVPQPKPTENLQNSANRIQKQLTSPTVTLILSVATIGAVVYLNYLLQPAYRGDPLPYTLAIVAELVSKQKDGFIDDGNSRTYLDAWIYSLVDMPK
jgi:hypothetical protein